MKKYFLYLAAALFSLGFTACEDVVAPYEIPGGGENPSDIVKNIPYEENFDTSLGEFKNFTTDGVIKWEFDSKRKFAKASGFNGVGNDANPGVCYLVSPNFSLQGQSEVHVVYEYIAFKLANMEDQQLMINPNFDKANPNEGWVALKAEHVSVTNWEDWKKADVQIPAEYMNKNVRLAFRYNCKEGKESSTFEIKNFKIEAGKAEGGEVTPQPTPDEVKNLPYGEEFSTTLGGFKSFNVTGKGEWTIDYHTAKITNHEGGADGTDYAGAALLVSPEITLEGQTEAHVSYEYILRYDKGQENQKFLICENFDEKNPDANWELLNGTHTEGHDWKPFSKADLAIPAKYMGKKIRVAFRYSSTDTGASTWEVKNFKIAAGKPGEGGNEGGNGEAENGGDTKALNGDFECWVDGLPNNWNGEAGSADLLQSKDAYNGKYSVLVKGKSGYNKRMAYKALDLKAGTYTYKAYLKSDAGATARFGFAKVPAAGGNDYVYSDYINNIPNEWTEYTMTLEIPADGKYNIIILNGKKPGTDFLVDNFSLTDANGNVIIK